MGGVKGNLSILAEDPLQERKAFEKIVYEYLKLFLQLGTRRSGQGDSGCPANHRGKTGLTTGMFTFFPMTEGLFIEPMDGFPMVRSLKWIIPKGWPSRNCPGSWKSF